MRAKKFDVCEFVLMNFKKIKAEVNSQIASNAMGGKDPTPMAAHSRISVVIGDIRLKDADRWAKVAEATRNHFAGLDEEGLLTLYYDDGLNHLSVMHRLHISKSTFYQWKDNIRIFFKMAACQEGIKKVF